MAIQYIIPSFIVEGFFYKGDGDLTWSGGWMVVLPTSEIFGWNAGNPVLHFSSNKPLKFLRIWDFHRISIRFSIDFQLCCNHATSNPLQIRWLHFCQGKSWIFRRFPGISRDFHGILLDFPPVFQGFFFFPSSLVPVCAVCRSAHLVAPRYWTFRMWLGHERSTVVGHWWLVGGDWNHGIFLVNLWLIYG